MMKTAKILLVDDDQLVRRALCMTLSSAGYVVIQAWTGEEALDKIQAEAADAGVVLLDLKLPGMDGLEACRRMREVTDIPILVISMLRETEDLEEASQAGADDYLPKPFGIQQLLSRIEALRRKAAAAELVLSV